MSTQDQARSLMIRHHHLIRNRQQVMLSRAAAGAGINIDANSYKNHIQGKPQVTLDYDRSGVGLS